MGLHLHNRNKSWCCSLKSLLPLTLLVLLVLLPAPASAVKSYLFKTCDQSGFCKRNRHYANKINEFGPNWSSPYKIDPSSLKINNDGVISGIIQKSILRTNNSEVISTPIDLPFQLSFLINNNVRLKIDEKKRLDPALELRGENKIISKFRYNEAAKWAFDDSDIHAAKKLDKNFKINGLNLELINEHGFFTITYGPNFINEAIVYINPFKVEFKTNGITQLILNDRGLLNVEHWRKQPSNEDDEKNDINLSDFEISDGMWKDEFKDSNKDTIPLGPESIGLDFSFIDYKHAYGIPQHADKLSLRETKGGEGNHNDPYRLMNVDIFEYEVDSWMPMYGSIPFLQSHKPGSSIGIFWINSADTWIDITKSNSNTQSHWISENGIIDVVIMLGPDPASILKSYTSLTGTTALPREFSLGYHQCRWNYNNEDDVLTVHKKMDEFKFPYDTIWLDIEYTDEKKYFTWGPETFPNYSKMLSMLNKTKRNLVAIIDPHLKVNYEVSKYVEDNKLSICNNKGISYHGHCWPGESIWIDTLNPKSKLYWKTLFKYGSKFNSDAKNLFLWNDMNEPSVFSGPETTIEKDAIYFGNWEDRSVHNLYGMTFHEATNDALIERFNDNSNSRSFVLTRSFFSGSQRTSAMWTGDNMSKWEYLKLSIPMVLNQGISGYPFAGSDVGGFFGDPSKELLTRWYQTGIFYPFFRAHAHIDSRRREPWIAGEPYTSIMRDAVRLRYSLMPTLYTSFHHSNVDGSPIMRPLFYHHPNNEETYEIEDEFYFTDKGILVKPVIEEGGSSVNIYLPQDDESYYDYFNYKKYNGKGYHKIEAPLEKIPILLEGGHIISRRDRYRRSIETMKYDPFTLVIVLSSKDGNAFGDLYLDDGKSFNFKSGDFIHVEFKFDSKLNKLTSINTNKSGFGDYVSNIGKILTIEKIIIIGGNKNTFGIEAKVSQGSKNWTSQILKEKSTESDVFIVRNPSPIISEDWEIQF